MALDIKAIAAKAAKEGTDYSKATASAGYTPPAAGPVNLRLVQYLEIGKHEKEIKGTKKTTDKVVLVFELSGPKHPAKEDGTPQVMRITETKATSAKANIMKLFKMMNYDADCTHFAEMLGRPFRGRIFHTEKGEGEDKVTYANLRDENGYRIGPPVVEVVDDETGDTTVKKIKVAEPKSELKIFLWDMPSKEMWDALYIDGTYDERKDDNGKVTRAAKSKNVVQELIKSAKNWAGSPMQVLLDEGDPDLGDELDTTAEVAKAKEEAKPAGKGKKAPAEKEEPAAEATPKKLTATTTRWPSWTDAASRLDGRGDSRSGARRAHDATNRSRDRCRSRGSHRRGLPRLPLCR
ncbi:hypothetical protein ACQUFY_05915 [Robbsia andropogonis]|uniref:hypothetical protein n=1 Tax=Robbsia andropogonis TaxID=28092 RepID=UPI003D2131EA